MARYLLGIPTWKGLLGAAIAIAICLGLAYVLYLQGGKTSTEFGLKVADYLLQGALVSLLFAFLKAIIDES